MAKTIEKKIELHNYFWMRRKIERPLVSFRIASDFFFATHFKAANDLLVEGKKITPSMLNVDSFLNDYERIYQDISSIGQDGFWVAEPFFGIPWMEAMLGCEIYATKSSFVSKPWVKSLEETKKIEFNAENEWFKKYMEFIEKLIILSRGRFPISQQIMRGPSDMVGALLGQLELVYYLVDKPEEMKILFSRVADIFLNVIKHGYNIIPKFYGGYSIGYFHIWVPEKCILFQEDLSAILSPTYYRLFLKKPDIKICKRYKYNAIHLHPSSFFILNDLLQIDNLKLIEINKDIGGPTISEMLPQFKRVLESKRLVIWGALDLTDLELIKKELPAKGLFLNIVIPSIEKAREILEFIEV